VTPRLRPRAALQRSSDSVFRNVFKDLTNLTEERRAILAAWKRSLSVSRSGSVASREWYWQQDLQ